MNGIGPGNFSFGQQETAISKGRGRIPLNVYQNQLSIETDSLNFVVDNYPEGEDPLIDIEQTIVQKFFKPGINENDTVVILNDGQFYVPRVMLFWLSPYFRNLIEIIPVSDPDSHFYTEIQVFFQWKVAQDRKFYEIFEMIRCLFPCPVQKSIDNKNFRLLLKLSDEYQIANLKHLCQEFLLREMNYSSIEKNSDKVELFELAAKHNLTKVFRSLLEFFVRLKTENFQLFYEKMDSEMIAVVLDAKLKLLCNYRDKKRPTKKSPGQSTTSDNETSHPSLVVGQNNLDDPSPRGTDEYSSDDYYSALDAAPFSSASRGDDCALCGETMKKWRRDYYQYWICNLCSKLAIVDSILYKKMLNCG